MTGNGCWAEPAARNGSIEAEADGVEGLLRCWVKLEGKFPWHEKIRTVLIDA